MLLTNGWQMLLRLLDPIYLTLEGITVILPLQVKADLLLFNSEGQGDSMIGVLCALGEISNIYCVLAEWVLSAPPPPTVPRSPALCLLRGRSPLSPALKPSGSHLP